MDRRSCQKRYADGNSGMIELLEAPQLRFDEITPDRWDDFETLFASRGGPENC